RFGDPETQAIVPRIAGGLAEPLARAAAGDLSGVELEVTDEAAVTVVLAAPGYPDAPETGGAVEGLDEAEADGALVFQEGTALRDGRLVGAGGRVLAVTALGDDPAEARGRAYAALERIRLPGAHYRRDIAAGGVRVAG
ncbi:MAG TPA: phosphoribosylglycinamide synthetase C domain-containing protein, partial [Gaiellaceae bacterium]|nr:phosphoribosylglycinamide synthetase C domain-containing protein [Gaiellaceae bacterium]